MKKIFLLFWLVLIFYTSSTTAIQITHPYTWVNGTIYSDQVSLSGILHAESQFYLGYLENHDSYLELGTEFYLRKIAHVFVYAFLSLFFFWNLSRFRLFFRVTFSWLLTVFIAFIDEFNQYLMVGRSGRLLDVALDSSAALILLSSVFVIMVLNRSKHTVRLQPGMNKQTQHLNMKKNTKV